MYEILSYIDECQKSYEQHNFFTKLLDNEYLTGKERLAWAPCVVPFIMGYSDLNKYTFRDESSAVNDDPLQRMLNIHTYEEDFHWQWMLDDLDKLGVNPKLTLSDAARIFWSPEMKASRQLCIEIAVLASQHDSSVVFAIVEAIEAVSITIFRHCQGIALESGVECEFFGTKHYLAEAGHLIKSETQPKENLPNLTEEQRELAKSAVDRVFHLFDSWSSSLLTYAKTHATAPQAAFAKMVNESENLPREVVLPEYAMQAHG
jgi:hypothetical protein